MKIAGILVGLALAGAACTSKAPSAAPAAPAANLTPKMETSAAPQCVNRTQAGAAVRQVSSDLNDATSALNNGDAAGAADALRTTSGDASTVGAIFRSGGDTSDADTMDTVATLYRNVASEIEQFDLTSATSDMQQATQLVNGLSDEVTSGGGPNFCEGS